MTNDKDQELIDFLDQEIAMSEHGKTIVKKTYPHQNLSDKDREWLLRNIERYQKVIRTVFWTNDEMWKQFCILFKIKE